MSRRPDYGYGGPRRNAPDPNMRIGDAERNQVADALSQHYSDGRLDDVELKERLDRAMSAKTNADLADLLSDLPPLGQPTPPPPPSSPRHRGVVLWGALLLVVFAAMAPVHHLLWWWFPAPPWLLIGGLVALILWRRARHRRYRSLSGQ